MRKILLVLLLVPIFAFNQEKHFSDIDVNTNNYPNIKLTIDLPDANSVNIDSCALSNIDNNNLIEIETYQILNGVSNSEILIFIYETNDKYLNNKKFLKKVSLLVKYLHNVKVFAYVENKNLIYSFHQTFKDPILFSKIKMLKLLEKNCSNNNGCTVLFLGEFKRNKIQKIINDTKGNDVKLGFIMNENSNSTIVKKTVLRFAETKQANILFFDLIDDKNDNLYMYANDKVKTLNILKQLKVSLVSNNSNNKNNVILDTLIIYNSGLNYRIPFSITIPDSLIKYFYAEDNFNENTLSYTRKGQFDKMFAYYKGKYDQELISATVYSTYINNHLKNAFDYTYNNKQLVKFVETCDSLQFDTISKANYLGLRKRYLLLQYTNMRKQNCYNSAFLTTNTLLREQLPDSVYLKAEYYNAIGYIAYDSKDYKTTLKNFKTSFNLTGSNYRYKEIHRVLKESLNWYYKEGKNKAFKNTYEKYHYFTTDLFQIKYQAAKVYYSLKDYSKSMKEFEWLNTNWQQNSFISKNGIATQIVELKILTYNFIDACNLSQNFCMSTNSADSLELHISYYLTAYKSLYLFLVAEILAETDIDNAEKLKNILISYSDEISYLDVYDKKSKKSTLIIGNDIEDVENDPNRSGSNLIIDYSNKFNIITWSNNEKIVTLKFNVYSVSQAEKVLIRNMYSKRKSSISWINFNLDKQEKYLMMISYLLGATISENNGKFDIAVQLKSLETSLVIEYIALWSNKTQKEIVNSFKKADYNFSEKEWQKSLTTTVFFTQEISKKQNSQHIIIDCCTPIFDNDKRTGIIRIGFNKIWN